MSLDTTPLLVSGVLITGGFYTSPLRSTEIYNPITKTTCSLPQIPEYRRYHTQDGDLTCGGGKYGSSTNATCVKWNRTSGTWTQSHTLRHKRWQHVSWETASGVYLIGGDIRDNRTSEKVKSDGSVEDAFIPKYNTRLYFEFK